MANYLEYKFEELPLLIADGKSAGLISGSAEIRYSNDGSWSIESIYVDGHTPVLVTETEKLLAKLSGNPAPRDWKWISVELGHKTILFDLIFKRLEGECRDGVQTAVREAIGTDIADREAAYADYRRSRMLEA